MDTNNESAHAVTSSTDNLNDDENQDQSPLDDFEDDWQPDTVSTEFCFVFYKIIGNLNMILVNFMSSQNKQAAGCANGKRKSLRIDGSKKVQKTKSNEKGDDEEEGEDGWIAIYM